MASVSSLDKDLRKLRLDKYTPAAVSEARQWIQETLGERLSSSDLLEALKDGVVLCKLVNLALPPPGVRYKQSAMPFVQMENISHFLRACQSPPLNLHQHDVFLTVDLYEQKDPAQVLQCLSAFSRAANAANPNNFPTAIGPKKGGGAVTPQDTGPGTPTKIHTRGASVNSNSSSLYGSSRPALANKTGDSATGRWSPTKSPKPGSGSPGPVSSWSKREHEGSTAPAWNIAQYGYMGGASQGNLGISFGGRRQITSAGPLVPSVVEKQRRRKEREAEEERLRQEAEEETRRQRAAEEERARLEEERLWEEETERLRDQERQAAEEERRKWEEEERQWKLTEEKRRLEEEEADARLEEERMTARSRSDARLRGQFLSQYRAEQASLRDGADEDGYRSRVQELEKELELARQREAEYERERQEKTRRQEGSLPLPKGTKAARPVNRHESWSRDEREVLRTAWTHNQEDYSVPEDAPALPSRSPRPLPETSPAPARSPRPLPKTSPAPARSPRPLPETSLAAPRSPRPLPEATPAPPRSPRPLPNPLAAPKSPGPNLGGRPLPDPTAYSPAPAAPSRTDRFLSSNPAPVQQAPQQTYSRELGATAEQDAEDRRRAQSQNKAKAGGWASKSLLEREMEMERQRQREWEEAQKETAAAVRSSDGVEGIGGGIGGRWDVGQWAGYTGGDSQNKGSQGIGAGRRQVVGPRPLPPEPR